MKFKHGGLLSLVVLPFLAGSALAQSAPKAEFVRQVDLEKFRLIAVQHDGRFKTFDTLARSALRNMSGKDVFQWEDQGQKIGAEQDAVFTYLDILFRPQAYRDARIVYIKEKAVLDRLIVPVKDRIDRRTLQAIFKDQCVSLNFLQIPEVQSVLGELSRDVVRSAKKVENILTSASYSDPRTLQRAMRMIPPPTAASQKEKWYSVEDLALAAMSMNSAHAGMGGRDLPGVTPEMQQSLMSQWMALQQSWLNQDTGGVNKALGDLTGQLTSLNPKVYPALSKLSLEHRYYRYNKMMWSWAVYFFALILLLMGVVYRWPRAVRVGTLVFALAFALHTAACGVRWYLAGRIPNSNMFEAVTAAAWFGCAVAIFVEIGPYLHQRRWIWNVSWATMVGGFVVWLGSLLAAGIPVGAWQEWPAGSIAALILFAVACMAIIALTVARRTIGYRGVPLVAASAVGMVALMCGQFLKTSLDSDIGRTMPVLNDLWLYVHTNMIIASYALIGLAFVTAALYLVGRMLTMPWDKAWPVWLCILIPTILIPLVAFPDVVNRIRVFLRLGDASPSAWPLTLDQMMSAWAPFLIVLGMYAVAFLTRLVMRIFSHGAAARARAVWDGMVTPDQAEPDMAMFALAGGVPAMAPSSAYAEAGVLSSSGGAAGRFSSLPARSTSLAKVLDGATMLLLELSFIMLWTGIIMGAIWADHSWGRPWGWDPKEVFALNTWIIFLILVHVRLKVVDKELWTAALAVLGTSVMMFNWVVVNFFIVGLHSYA